MARRMERTTDPERLAKQLENNIAEIAEYASRVGRTADLAKIRTTLDSVFHQLHNAACQVSEHIGAIDDAKEFGGAPEWDVVAEPEPEPSNA